MFDELVLDMFHEFELLQLNGVDWRRVVDAGRLLKRGALDKAKAKGFGAAALDSATRANIGPDDTRPADGATVVVPIRFKAGN